MNKLSIFWEAKTSPYLRWYLTDDNKVVEDLTAETGLQEQAISQLESHQLLKSDLELLTNMAKGKKVELILNGYDVHLDQVELPTTAKRHISKAVPYLIEEFVAEPIDDFFIAQGEKNKQQQIPVRAIRREYLQSILQAFKKAEIQLKAVYLELDLLAIPQQGFTAVIKDDALLVIQDDQISWQCDRQEFSWLIEKKLQAMDEELPVAIPLQIITEQQNEITEDFINQLPTGRFATEITQVKSVEQWVLESKNKPINLLQGEFAVKSENSRLKNLLTQVASIAAVVLVAFLLYQASQWFSLHQQYQKLSAQKAVLWKQAFPGEKYPRNSDRVLASRMKQLAGANQQNAFLAMLSSVSSQIEDLQKLYPTNISYDAIDGEIRLDLIAKELEGLNQYKEKLKQAGFDTEGGSATQRGDGYASRLTVRRENNATN